eukprot:TRINITY_DN8907_c0_g2_i2.p2 TRINITY_DN8907_c0_g2~~TRINITY_DN8907_c0_g2_i2.p2  ORF type:complete len:134 (+),score=23.45 TRINITY_DN8907_c0_g2_i2:147-548(+)
MAAEHDGGGGDDDGGADEGDGDDDDDALPVPGLVPADELEQEPALAKEQMPEMVLAKEQGSALEREWEQRPVKALETERASASVPEKPVRQQKLEGRTVVGILETAVAMTAWLAGRKVATMAWLPETLEARMV